MNAEDGQPVKEDARHKLANYLEIKVSPERATLALKANHLLEKLTPTAEDLAWALNQAGAVNGLDLDLLGRVLSEKLFDRTHIVAQAVAPVPGEDAVIETLVRINGEAKPVVLSDGRADYRNVDNIRQVAAGEVLQRKHPATEGKPGCDVQGKPIPAKPGTDAALKPGINTKISDDGNTLVSTRGGYLFMQGEALGVGEDFQLQGDVNFKTGNILYHGDVLIQGNVADGFSVEADGNIVIEGSVDGAVVISREGSVTIKGALFGHGHAEIRAGKDIDLQAAQDAKIFAGGCLAVAKELRLCEVRCGSLKANAPNCHVLGGALVIYGETLLAQVGGEGVRTEIRVGDKAHEEARAELGGIASRLEQLKQLASALEPRLKQFKTTADRMHGHLPVRMAADLKATVTRYAETQKGMRGLAEEEKRLRDLLASPLEKRWPVVITEKVIDSAHVKLYGKHVDLAAGDAPGQWLWTEEGPLKASLG